MRFRRHADVIALMLVGIPTVAIIGLLLGLYGPQAHAQRVVRRTMAVRARPGPVPAPVVAPDEQTLKSANIPTGDKELLDFLHKRSTTEVSPGKMTELIDQLSSATAATHEKAGGELVSLGVVAVPALRKAANNLDDLELAVRARHCLELIEGSGGANLSKAAIHVLGQRKPAGAAGALLAYLPYAEDDGVVQDIQATLVTVATHDGKPDPALLRALKDESPIRRATAADTLCQIDGSSQDDTVRPLLKDPKPTVRLRVALNLARHHEAAAIPVLIDLLADVPAEQCKPAEEYLASLAGEWTVSAPQGDDPVVRRLRRQVWAAWWEATAGGTLLDEFRKRTLSDDDLLKAQGYIRELGDAKANVRERACGRLVALGPLVTPLLRQALREGNRNVAAEAEKCLSQLGREGPGPLPSAAARLLALRKPAGSAEVLLRYLPFADTDDMAEELRTTLTAVARHDGKIEPALEKALTDKVATRRAVAAEVLASVATAAELKAVKPLLKDPEPTVRLRAALALASAQDRGAVPTLIALLTELPADQAWPAEECLLQLAGDKGPDAPQGSEPAERAKKRKAWEAWWKKNGAKVDLLVLKGRTNHEPFHNYTLLVGNNNNMISELDAEGKERWQITGVINPMDARMLPGNRVLVAEFGGNRVSERNLKGEVLWDKAVAWPISAERLPNGNTLIVARNEILEVSREKKEVFAYRRNMNDIMAGRRLRSGELIVVTSSGQCLRLDSKGKQVGMFPINVGSMGIDVLPNGHVLSPGQWGSNRVQEFDTKGKVVWEAAAPPQTVSASRAPNGNTIVTTNMWPPKVAEIDKKGKVVWEHPLTTYAMRARKR